MAEAEREAPAMVRFIEDWAPIAPVTATNLAAIVKKLNELIERQNRLVEHLQGKK